MQAAVQQVSEPSPLRLTQAHASLRCASGLSRPQAGPSGLGVSRTVLAGALTGGKKLPTSSRFCLLLAKQERRDSQPATWNPALSSIWTACLSPKGPPARPPDAALPRVGENSKDMQLEDNKILVYISLKTLIHRLRCCQ